MRIVGVGKNNENDVTPIVQDRVLPYVKDNETENVWGLWAPQDRDLFFLDRQGNFQSTINLSSSYPENDILALVETLMNIEFQPERSGDCIINPSEFSEWMTLTARVSPGSYSESLADSLYAFSRSSCRGSTAPIDQNGQNIYYLTVYGNGVSSDTLDFYIYRSLSNNYIRLNQSILFEPGESVGNPSEPFEFTQSDS